jgi:hypothetical protein
LHRRGRNHMSIAAWEGEDTVSVVESGWSATPDAINRHLEALTVALTERGFVAETIGARMVWAKNSDADPSDEDPRSAASPGLRQTVVCQHDAEGRLGWFWVWSGPTSGAHADLEYMCPAANIDQAADRIASVLRLDGIDRSS